MYTQEKSAVFYWCEHIVGNTSLNSLFIYPSSPLNYNKAVTEAELAFSSVHSSYIYIMEWIKHRKKESILSRRPLPHNMFC